MAAWSISSWCLGSPCQCHQDGVAASPRPGTACEAAAGSGTQAGILPQHHVLGFFSQIWPRSSGVITPKMQLGFQECEFPLCLPACAVWRGGRAAGRLRLPRTGDTTPYGE